MTVKDHTDEFRRRLEHAVNEGLGTATLVASEYAKQSMPGAGARAWIPKGATRLSYKGSNIGSPPGVRTGLLRNSITNARLGKLRWGYGTKVKYGRYVGLGYDHPGGTAYIVRKQGAIFVSKGTEAAYASIGVQLKKTKAFKVAPRPFLQPAYEQNREAIQTAFSRTAAREMERGAIRG
jgi:hypothetical protein